MTWSGFGAGWLNHSHASVKRTGDEGRQGREGRRGHAGRAGAGRYRLAPHARPPDSHEGHRRDPARLEARTRGLEGRQVAGQRVRAPRRYPLPNVEVALTGARLVADRDTAERDAGAARRLVVLFQRAGVIRRPSALTRLHGGRSVTEGVSTPTGRGRSPPAQQTRRSRAATMTRTPTHSRRPEGRSQSRAGSRR